MRKLRRMTAMAVALGVISTLIMSGTAAAQDADDTTGEIVSFSIGTDSDITSLNPFRLCCDLDYEYLELVYDLGFNYTAEDLSPAPNIITAWEPSADHMTYELTIRTDATFHDGEPMTAEDVAFTFGFVAKYQMPFFKDYFPFEPTFEVVDDDTVLWKSTEPTFAPEVPAYMPILPEHIWGQFDTAGDNPSDEEAKEIRALAGKEFENDPPIGTGPFVFEEWSIGQFMRFSANPDYWGDTGVIDEVIIRVYDSPEAKVQALRSGELDFADSVQPALFNSLQGQEGITTHVADGGCWGNIAYNFGGQGPDDSHHPAAEDVTVRQAVAHAIDKQRIVEQVYQNTAVVGDSILMPGRNGAWYTDIPPELEFPYDPAVANQMLDDAGYLDTDDDGVREMPDGTNPLIWEFMVITDVDGSVDTGRLMQGFLQEIGIQVEFKTVNQNKANDLWFSGDWDVYVWDWCPEPDPDFMLSVFTTDQCLSWSDGCYSNPEYDELYEAQRSALDRSDRKAIIDEMQLLIAEEVPTMVLNYWSDLQAYRSDRWTGFKTYPDVENGLLMVGYGTGRNYANIQLVGDETGAPSSSGLPAWVWVAIVGGVAVVAGLVLMARRKSDAEDEA